MPTRDDIEKLLAYLPVFDRPGREFITEWRGGEKLSDGSLTLPYPVYTEDVNAFFQLAAQPCWLDHTYHPATAAKMLDDAQAVSQADMQSLRTMLTYCVRGERFCDGLRGDLLQSGQLVALLKRLQQLQTSSGPA